MSFVEELSRLEQMRAAGTLSDEEFQRAKARLLDPSSAPQAPAITRLRRSADDRWLGGVCGGLGAVSGIESWIWRLLFALLMLFGGTGIVIYVLLWIFVPAD